MARRVSFGRWARCIYSRNPRSGTVEMVWCSGYIQKGQALILVQLETSWLRAGQCRNHLYQNRYDPPNEETKHVDFVETWGYFSAFISLSHGWPPILTGSGDRSTIFGSRRRAIIDDKPEYLYGYTKYGRKITSMDSVSRASISPTQRELILSLTDHPCQSDQNSSALIVTRSTTVSDSVGSITAWFPNL